MNAIVLSDVNNTSRRRKPSPVVHHICDFCTIPFLGVRQKKYCSKHCNEAACRARKTALIDALLLEFAPFGANYGLTRAHIERCANADLERCQNIAAALGLRYADRERVWKTTHRAMLYVV